jgi:hypothetical protein
MGNSCLCHKYDSVYSIKKREVAYKDRKEIYTETHHQKTKGVVEIEGSMTLPNLMQCKNADRAQEAHSSETPATDILHDM